MTVTRWWMYGTVGQLYWGYVEVTGGVAPYTISIDALPDGLALNPTPVDVFGGNPGGDFEFTGTPTTAGTTPVNITVNDSSGGGPVVYSDAFVVNTLEAPYMGLPPATVGTPYAFQYDDAFADALFILAFGSPGAHPYSYSFAVPLFRGLFLYPSGLLSGNPTFPLATGQIGVDYCVADIFDANGATCGNASSNQVAFFAAQPPPPMSVASTIVPSSGGAVSRCQVSHVLPSRLLARDWSAFQRQIEALRPADVEEVRGSRFDFC